MVPGFIEYKLVTQAAIGANAISLYLMIFLLKRGRDVSSMPSRLFTFSVLPPVSLAHMDNVVFILVFLYIVNALITK